MSPVTFTVVGEPKAQPRVKAASRGAFIQIYTPGTAKAWKKLVRDCISKLKLPARFEGPLEVNFAFRMPRPKNHYRNNGQLKLTAPYWHTKKPDKDNLEKAVMDAATDAGLWRDDCLVCKSNFQKIYAEPPAVGCSVFVSPLPSTPPDTLCK